MIYVVLKLDLSSLLRKHILDRKKLDDRIELIKWPDLIGSRSTFPTSAPLSRPATGFWGRWCSRPSTGTSSSPSWRPRGRGPWALGSSRNGWGRVTTPPAESSQTTSEGSSQKLTGGSRDKDSPALFFPFECQHILQVGFKNSFPIKTQDTRFFGGFSCYLNDGRHFFTFLKICESLMNSKIFSSDFSPILNWTFR